MLIAILGLMRKILERHRKGFDEEMSGKITELTREKVWEVSTALRKIVGLVDVGEIFGQAVKYFKVRFPVSE